MRYKCKKCGVITDYLVGIHPGIFTQYCDGEFEEV